MGQGWRRVSWLRTFRCQSPAERIPICAGTQVEAVGAARLERVREGRLATVPSGLVRFKNRQGKTLRAVLCTFCTPLLVFEPSPTLKIDG